MGRFYKTAQPEFIDDFIYQLPWELIEKNNLLQAQDYGNIIQSTELIKNMMDIKHLSFEDDRVKEKKSYYNSKIDEITNQLGTNSKEYHKVIPLLRNLSRELDADRKEGDISKIEGRYNWLLQKQKDNAEVLKADPSHYNGMLNYEYSDLVKRATNDINAVGGSEKYVAKPDMNSKELRDLFEKFKADKWEQISKDGRWINTTKEAKEREIQQAFLNVYSSNPLVSAYVKQKVMLKDPSYFDEVTGKPLELFHFVDNTGKVITKDEAIKLQENWDKKSPFPFDSELNLEHGFAGGMKGFGSIYGFKETEKRENKFKLNEEEHEHKTAEINLKGKLDFYRDRANWKDKVKSLILEYELKGKLEKEKEISKLKIAAAKGDEDAEEALKEIFIQTTVEDIANPTKDYTSNLEGVVAKNPQAQSLEHKAREYARAELKNFKVEPGGLISKFWKVNNPDILQRVNKNKQEFLKYIDYETAKGVPLDKAIKNYTDITYKRDKSRLDVPANQMQKYYGADYESTQRVYKDLANTYIEKKQEWFDTKYSGVKGQKSFHPLSTQGQIEMLNLYENRPTAWQVTDLGGKPIHTKVTKIQRATDGQGKGMLGFQGIDENNKKVLIFPQSLNSATVNIATNITTSNLQDPKSYLKSSLSDSQVKDLTYLLNSTGSFKDGSKGVIYNFNGNQIPIKNANGKGFFITNPNTNKPITNSSGESLIFESEKKVIEFLRKATKF